MASSDNTGLQLRSTVKSDGILELALIRVPTPDPQPDEVVVRIEASPLNPSDIGLLLNGVDLTTLKASGNADSPILTGTVPADALRFAAPRHGQSLPVGNEGAGVVVAAGSSPVAQALLGKT